MEMRNRQTPIVFFFLSFVSVVLAALWRTHRIFSPPHFTTHLCFVPTLKSVGVFVLSQLTGQCMSMVQVLRFALGLLEDFAPECCKV